MKRNLFVILLVILSIFSSAAGARMVDGLLAPGPKQQIGPKTHYSIAEVQAAVANAPGYDAALMGQAGALAVNMESGGNAGIWNGTCCTGLLQMNVSNLAKYGYTPHSYAKASMQDQVNAWVKLTASAATAGAVQRLRSMGTFDGQPVDSALLLSCIQLGTGNCSKMVNSGRCNGFADSNGTSICKMAQAIRRGSSSGAMAQGTTKTGGNGSSGNLAKAEPTPSLCTPDMIDTEVGAGLTDLKLNIGGSNQ